MYSTLWGAIRGANRSSVRASTPYGPRSEIERLRALGRFARETPCRAYLPVRTACRTPAASCGALGALPPRLRRPLKGRCAGGQGASSRRPCVPPGRHQPTAPTDPIGPSWPPSSGLLRSTLPAPLQGSGALGFAPQTAFRTHSQARHRVRKLPGSPHQAVQPGPGLKPPFTGLLATAPATPPGLWPGPLQRLPRRPARRPLARSLKHQACLAWATGSARVAMPGHAPGSAWNPHYAAWIPSGMRM